VNHGLPNRGSERRRQDGSRFVLSSQQPSEGKPFQHCVVTLPNMDVQNSIAARNISCIQACTGYTQQRTLRSRFTHIVADKHISC